uniref:Uncharacterized protein n=1 Tax=Romanomermis culicivorax TaxID=13658 RepID=A0A915IKM8_ROMCU
MVELDNRHDHCSGHRGIGHRDSEEGHPDYRNGCPTDLIAKDSGCGCEALRRPCSRMTTCMFELELAIADWFRDEESAGDP